MDNTIAKTSEIKTVSVEPVDIIWDLYSENVPIRFDGNSNLAKRVSKELLPDLDELFFYKIIEVSYEKDFPQKEAFENVISSFSNNSFFLVYLLSGDKKGVSIYLGIAENYKVKDDENTVNGYDVAEALINSFLGNYYGSKVKKLSQEEMENEIIKKIKRLKRKSFIHGIPSENEQEIGQENVFQGVERLINSMRGETYLFLIVSELVDKDDIYDMLDKVYAYYNKISQHAEKDVSENKSKSVNRGQSEGKTEGRSKGKSVSKSSGETEGSSSHSTNKGKSTSENSSESHSTSETTNWGVSESTGKTTNIKIVEREIKEQLNYIDEELIPRLQFGLAKGLFKTAIYAMSTDNATLDKLEGNIKSIFQGDKSTFVPLREVRLFDNDADSNTDKKHNQEVSNLLSHFQIFHTDARGDEDLYLLQNIEVKNNKAELATYLTATELSLIAGMPLRETPGIILNEAVDFGVNVPEPQDQSDYFELGNIVQRGIELKQNRVKLSKSILNKHVFITGVTGSGKTTTSQKLLLEAKLPFFVIEPAKTEYRQLYELDEEIIFFTAGVNNLSPFEINPFELIEGENLSSHIDMLMATFTATYPMEAAMPYILKEAIINCYENLGWDLDTSENEFTDNPWEANGIYWPTFSDLLKELKNVVNKKGFAAELKSNYIGSLVARFSDLTVGTRGSMFNVPLSVNFEQLIEKKVVLELDELKNEEDKIMVMGFVLSKIREVLKKKHRENPNFKHITLIEEAHRLLTEPVFGEASKKQGVQTFTDMLAEVRKYGESLIIIDQIPKKLTPDVMKNTNTKIIHKIFAEDDKSAIAHTMDLEEEQKDFLSKLKVGEAIVFSEGWQKPVWVKIKAASNIKNSLITEKDIAESGIKYQMENAEVFFPFYKQLPLGKEQIEFLMKRKKRLVKKLLKYLKENLGENKKEEIKKILKEFVETFGDNERDNVLTSLANEIWYIYRNINENSLTEEYSEIINSFVQYFTAILK